MKTRITHAFSSILLLALLCVGLVLPLLNVVPSVQAADSTILTPKWNVTGQPEGESGVLIADINKDGREEVIRAAAGWIRVFDGVTGAVLWGRPDAALSTMAKPQMADLNNDGFLEIIVNIARGVMAYRFPNGVIANGAVYWRRNDLSGYANHWSSPVVGIIDGGVYPTVFVGGEDAESGNLSGRVTALKYDGTVLRQAFTWRPCFGGLSLADTDSDGHFELFQGDRSNSYGDGGYGRGIRCFWAENLSVKWERPEILCSSHCPLLVDVNKDGILEVIAGQTGNTCVLNSIDGSFIRPQVRDTDSFPIHFQPSAYDIDLDGNPELLMADGHDNTADDVIVWDLTTWHLDANISRTVVGKCYYGPKAADVTGDGVMELIACSYGSVFVIDHANFTVLDRETLQGDYYSMRLTYAVVNDIDGDGLAELVVSSFGGNIWAFDTHAPKSNPRARSEVQHYSEMRLGAAEYVPPPGSTANPLILNASPSDKSSNVPVTLSALKFTLKDYQNNVMSYNVVTSPNIGSWSGNNVASGTTISLGPLSLSYSTTYTWRVNVTDSGGHLTSRPFSFRTEFAPVSNVAPIQGDPLLVSSSNPPAGGDTLTCSNQSTSDANGNPVTNIYNWYRNDVSLATLIMPFDIRNEVTAKDYSGYNNNGAVNGATWTSAGMVGGCYDFPSGGNIVVPYSPSLDGNGTWSEITVEHWIYFTVDQDGTRTIEKTWSYEIGFQQGSTNRLYAAIWTRSDPFNGYRATSTYTLSKNTWYHVVMTYKDGVGLFLYVNGVLRASRTDRVGLIQSCAALGPFVGPNTPEPLYIGWFNSFRGKIDEVRIYRKALSQQQISQRYTETRYGLSTSSVMTGSETVGGTWKCQVTPNDGYADGTAKTATVFLGNAPPTFAGVYITPDPAFDSSTLTAHPYGWFDADGDAESYVYQWQILSGGTWQDLVGRTSATLGSSYSGPGDYVRIRVTPYDGEDYGTARYQTKWIASFSSLTDPLLLSSLGTNTTDEDLTCYNQTSTATTNIYNWYVNGVPLANLLMPFNNNSASTAADYSGYSNNGAVTGATWTTSAIEGGAYNFNGDDVITVADSASLSGSWSEITVEYWAYPSVDQRGARILNKNGGAAGTSGKYMTGINTDANGPANVIFFGVTVGGSYQETYSNTATAIPTGSWSHIVGTYRSGEGIKLYINGVLKSSADGITGNIDASVGEPLFIGYSSGTPGTANRYFNGTLDEMRIYSRALSPEQAFQRYLESKDNLFTSSTIVSQETEAGETWRCLVTPSRSTSDLASRYSNSLTIGGAQYGLLVSTVGSGTTNATGTTMYNASTAVAVQATPSPGWILSHWLLNGTNMGATPNPYVVVMSENRNLTAVFVAQYGLLVKVGDSGGGITNATGTTMYPAGTTVNVLATPDPNWVLSKWLLNGTDMGATPNPFGVTMSENRNLTAVFAEKPKFNLLVEVSGSGSTNATGTALYDSGTVVAVQATPGSGWTLSHWLLNGTNVGSANPYSVTMTENRNLTAMFAEVPQYELLVGVSGSGVTNATGTAMYNVSTMVNVLATPSAGWTLNKWLLNGSDSGSANPYTLTMTANYNLTAIFTENAYLVVRGASNEIWYRMYNSTSSTWENWNLLPGATVDSPAAAVVDNELHIVIRGVNSGEIWHGYVNLTDNTFSGWTLLSGNTPSAPTLTSYGSKLILVVRGFTNAVYYRYYDTVSEIWGAWIPIPDGATCDSPAAAVLGSSLHLVIRGFSTTDASGNNTLWHGTVNLADDSFSGWTNLPGGTPSAPRLAASETSGKLYLNVRGMSDVIWINTWNGTTWEGWTALPNGATCDAPALTVVNGELHIVVRNITGDALWHYYINLSTEAHSGWIAMDGFTPSAPSLTS